MEPSEQSEEQLLDAIFKSNTKPRTTDRIQISNETDIIIQVLPHDHKKDPMRTEDEYDDFRFHLFEKAAQGIFSAIYWESCIALWLELTKLIKKHCSDEDESNEECTGKPYPPEGWFRAMFNKTAKDDYVRRPNGTTEDRVHVE